MHKLIIALAAIIAITPSCAVKTVFYDVNPEYESHTFQSETVAVCPFNGLWKIEGTDTAFKRELDFNLYPGEIAKEIGKKRKCLSVLQPEIVAQKFPEIELFLFKHKHTYKNSGSVDTSVLAALHRDLPADYLLFFENLLFSEENQTTEEKNKTTMEHTKLIFQLWDLKQMRFMYRGEAKGIGGASNDSRSSRGTIQNTARELVKSLPVCR